MTDVDPPAMMACWDTAPRSILDPLPGDESALSGCSTTCVVPTRLAASSLLGHDIHGDDGVGADQGRTHDGAHADAAAAEDRDAVARLAAAAVLMTAPAPVVTAHPMRAATSSGMSSRVPMAQSRDHDLGGIRRDGAEVVDVLATEVHPHATITQRPKGGGSGAQCRQARAARDAFPADRRPGQDAVIYRRQGR